MFFTNTPLRLKGIDREALMKHLESKGIPTMVYYPFPLHVQQAFRYLGYHENDFPVPEELCRTVLSLAHAYGTR